MSFYKFKRCGRFFAEGEFEDVYDAVNFARKGLFVAGKGSIEVYQNDADTRWKDEHVGFYDGAIEMIELD